MKLRAAEVFPRFGQRRYEMRMLGASQRHHGEAMRKWREMLFELVRRPAGRNEMDFIEIEAAVGRVRDAKVSAVDGIERAAEQPNAAWMMFLGGAVRLRCRQCASQGFSVSDFLMNWGFRPSDGPKGQLPRPLQGCRLHP